MKCLIAKHKHCGLGSCDPACDILHKAGQTQLFGGPTVLVVVRVCNPNCEFKGEAIVIGKTGYYVCLQPEVCQLNFHDKFVGVHMLDANGREYVGEKRFSKKEKPKVTSYSIKLRVARQWS